MQAGCAVAGDDEGQGPLLLGNHLSGQVDHVADRRTLDADDADVGDQRPEPVEEVEQVRPRDAGEEILVPAREPDDLMREDRAENQQLVVVVDQLVDLHRHRLGEEAVRSLQGLGLAESAERHQRLGVVPLVIEELRLKKQPHPLDVFDPQQLADLHLGHRWVSPQRDEDIQRRDMRLEMLKQSIPQQRQRSCARRVRDDQQQPLARDIGNRHVLDDPVTDFVVGQNRGRSGHEVLHERREG